MCVCVCVCVCDTLSIETIGTRQITWLARVHKVVVKDDVNGPRELPGRRTLWHLLNREFLVVLVRGQTVLCHQRISLVILVHECEREDGGKEACGGTPHPTQRKRAGGTAEWQSRKG